MIVYLGLMVLENTVWFLVKPITGYLVRGTYRLIVWGFSSGGDDESQIEDFTDNDSVNASSDDIVIRDSIDGRNNVRTTIRYCPIYESTVQHGFTVIDHDSNAPVFL